MVPNKWILRIKKISFLYTIILINIWLQNFSYFKYEKKIHLQMPKLLQFRFSCDRKNLSNLQLCLDFGVKTYHIISLNPSWWISRNLDFFIRRKLNYCAIFFQSTSCYLMLNDGQTVNGKSVLCRHRLSMQKNEKKNLSDASKA